VIHALLVARTVAAVTVTAGALLALGADFTATACAATQTAQTVLLAANV
jgi:hypothetical protein